mgnify:CR=1 FL=1
MVLIRIFSRIPFFVLYRISDFLYFLLFYVIRYRRKVVRQNMEKSFPELPLSDLRSLEAKFYRFFTDLVIETIKCFTISEKEVRKRVSFINPEVLEEPLNKGISVLVYVSHQGNWELLGHAAKLYFNFPLDATYQKLENAFFNKAIYKMRTRFGVFLMEKLEVFRVFYARRDITRMIAMIADQSPKKGENRIWTTFLNQETCFFQGTEKLAGKFHYPVFVTFMKQTKRGYYSLYLKEIKYSSQDEPGTITRKFSKMLEEQIREQPHTYLWTHKRWKIKKQKAN